jgi:hypothetical protein
VFSHESDSSGRGGFITHVIDDHVRAERREQISHRLADSARTTSDDRDFSS